MVRCIVAGCVALWVGLAPVRAASVLTYHNTPNRHGLYTVPGLTLAAAAGLHADGGFAARISGNVYAQALYWDQASGPGLVLVPTENNIVYGLNADSGAIVWQTALPAPALRASLPCGNIDPEGITGTPVIDGATGTMYFNALVAGTTATGPRQMLYAMNVATGTVVPGWPVDMQAALAARGVSFRSTMQGQRSALSFFQGDVYVSYGGKAGDCGVYHGMVVQVHAASHAIVASWATRANGGGIWAQGGLARGGNAFYATTGNTFGAASWADGEAVVRLHPGLARSTAAADYFAPANWQSLDRTDTDLGGTEALPIGVYTSATRQTLRSIAFGKDGNAYLLNTQNLGGIGGALAVVAVSNAEIITAPAVYTSPTTTLVTFTNSAGKSCAGNNLTTLKIAASGAAPITTAWCQEFAGRGAPIITTSDGVANPVVWVVGAEGDGKLHGYNALTGSVVYGGGTTVMNGLHHFQTILATHGHLYVGADNTVYSFTFTPG